MQQPVRDIEPEPTRRLVLIRHARAEAFADTDLGRRLTSAGTADARALAVWLLSMGVHPDRVLVSPAARTRQTWAAITEVTAWGVAAEFDECLYAGDTNTVSDELRATEADVRTVVVIGHNPTIAYLAQILADGEGEPAAELAMAAGFPTCAAAMFTLEVTWPDLAPGSGQLSAFHVGRS